MRKTLLFTICLLISFQMAVAQGPKWVLKAKRAVFSVISFDHENNILKKGNGFFIDDRGIAVSDYSIFKDAYKAVIIDTNGKEMPVHSILGADDTYDVVKFRVDTRNRKVDALEINKEVLAAGAEAIVLPYSVERDRACQPGVIRTVENIRGDFKYYTLDMRSSEFLASCPVMTSSGLVFGLMEPSFGSGKSDIISHAVDINFINSLTINALSFDDPSLNNIYIKKGLPLEEDQALAYLFIVKERLSSSAFFDLLKDYQELFPNSLESYFGLARYYLEKPEVSKEDLNLATKEIDKALELKDADLSEACYTASKLISSGHFLTVAKDNAKWSLDRALRLINKAIELNDLPIYHQTRGDIYTVMEQWDKALEDYTLVNNSNISSPQSYFLTARVLEQAGRDSKEVIQALDSCVSKITQPYDFTGAPYLFERGRVHADAGDYRKSIADLNDYFYAVNGQVNDQFYYFREQVALNARMYQQALDDIQAAIKLNPEELLYYAEHAAINLKVGRYQEALAIVDDILAINSEYAEAYRLQAIAYNQLKDKRACASLKKADELGDSLAKDLMKTICK